MLKPEQVPKEVVDAFWQHFQDNKSTDGAIAAALNAWPGKGVEHREVLNFGNNIDGPIVSANRVPFLILPLPEASDDQ